uniref:Uncharacterized protein n=1 Tax=Salix viminalis TaxID=40686 RepID=A0A6N2KDF0_SALVM
MEPESRGERFPAFPGPSGHISALLLQFDSTPLRRLTVRLSIRDPATRAGWAAVGFRRTWLSDGLRPSVLRAELWVLTHLESRSSSELNEGLLTCRQALNRRVTFQEWILFSASSLASRDRISIAWSRATGDDIALLVVRLVRQSPLRRLPSFSTGTKPGRGDCSTGSNNRLVRSRPDALDVSNDGLKQAAYTVPRTWDPRICMQDELTGVPINRATRFTNKVGFLAGESLIKERAATGSNSIDNMDSIVYNDRQMKGFLKPFFIHLLDILKMS